jgi:uncharacterized protein
MQNKGFVMFKKFGFASAAFSMLMASTAALADVKTGVEAWGRGDYATAITQWRGPAIAGDADAQFNMAQAYKLGRGVPIDLKMAEEWYRKAAAQGHLQAEDNYGLILFQNGDRQRALPIIERSAGRGEPRAQYVYGTALFNGDMIAKDWPRAYALMTRASAAGLAPASSSLAQMDKFVPLEQRQRGMVMAREMEAYTSRPQTAMNDLPPAPRTQDGAPVVERAPVVDQAPSWEAARPAPMPAPIPAPSRRSKRDTDVDIARNDAEARLGGWRTGPAALPPPSERRRPRAQPPVVAPEQYPEPAPMPPVDQYPPQKPQMDEPPMAEAPGTGYPAPDAYPSAPAPVVRTRPAPPPAPVVRKAPTVQTVGGRYRVQLGAFSDANRAKALWSSLSGNVGGLKGMQPYLVKAGPITRLQAGLLGSKAAADKLCGQVRAAAQSCLVIAP